MNPKPKAGIQPQFYFSNSVVLHQGVRNPKRQCPPQLAQGYREGRGFLVPLSQEGVLCCSLRTQHTHQYRLVLSQGPLEALCKLLDQQRPILVCHSMVHSTALCTVPRPLQKSGPTSEVFPTGKACPQLQLIPDAHIWPAVLCRVGPANWCHHLYSDPFQSLLQGPTKLCPSSQAMAQAVLPFWSPHPSGKVLRHLSGHM